MRLPPPAPGLVLRYAFLWRREFDAGQDEGRAVRRQGSRRRAGGEDHQPEHEHAPPSEAIAEGCAEQEQGGNLSRMVGVLLSEALALRSRPVLAERLADRFGENSEASEDVDG